MRAWASGFRVPIFGKGVLLWSHISVPLFFLCMGGSESEVEPVGVSGSLLN